MSEYAISSLAPPEIVQAYYPDGIAEESVLTGGIINTTLLITDTVKRRSILQRLSPIFDESMAADFAIVSDHLRCQGWEVASALKSSEDVAYVPDEEGNLWRSFSYIESDGVVPPTSHEANIALSGLLGRLHNTLSSLDYRPQFSLPHFHETAHYADRLEALLPALPDAVTRTLGAEYIALTRKQTIPSEPAQIIHGDPKMANALYRAGLPFTFIDFDTLMKANPLVDVGDMLRSITGKLAAKDPNFTTKDLEPTLDAYYDQAKPGIDRDTFIKQALNAGQVIALELGIRYLIDAVEDSYFDWDSDQFASRSEHNIARARIQWQTYEALGR